MRSIARYSLVGVTCFVLTGFLAAVKFPLLFKYADSLEIVEESYIQLFTHNASSVTVEETQRLEKLVANIPFVPQSRDVFTVSYEDKFRRTIEEGDGNCSNHVTAISWYILRKLHTKSFNIVHFLPRESFINGFGHTVVDFDGIYDVFEGGVWINESGRKVSLQDVLDVNPQVGMKQLVMRGLNSKKENKNKTYVNDLIGMNLIGITPAESFQEYLEFIDRIYIPISNKQLEKYFYDAVALFFSKLPKVYTVAKPGDIYGKYDVAITLAKLWLFIVRLLPFLVGLLFLWKMHSTLIKR